MKSFLFGLAVVVLMVAGACGGDSLASPTPTPSPAPSGSSSSVTIPVGAERLTTTAFSPDLADINVGTTITWTNRDAVAHTSTSDTRGWDSGIVAPGGQFSFTFQTAGTFSYHCAIHPGMIGTVVVH